MKKTIKNLLYIIAILGLNACDSSFLDVTPKQNIAIKDAIKDVNSLQSAVNGIYSQLQNDDYYGRTMILVPDLMPDNIYLSSSNSSSIFLNVNRFEVKVNDSEVENAWNVMYSVAVNSTRAIKGAEAFMEADEKTATEDAKQILGEAYTLRAMAHFDLLRLFAQPYNFTSNASHAGVPLITEVSDQPTYPSRNTVKEGYQLVVADLTKALSLLSEETGKGIISINATKALLARVYLYQEEWTEAAQMATEVIESGKYALYNAEDLPAKWDQEFNDETIFEIINNITDHSGSNSLAHFFDPDGYAYGLATEDLVNLYTDQDSRTDFFYLGDKGNEKDVYFVYKYSRNSPNKAVIQDENIKLIRFSELYLIRAEAYAELANDTKAQEDLQTIVQRAEPTAAPITVTGQELKDRILLERRKELAFEGHRLFDLTRKKKDVMINRGDDVLDIKYPNERFIFPIPLRELNTNPNLEQNPGY
ncbi:RagB/SusD family nutrient uptake outer membrane protein [Rapidithrix thailandica]|uniref:RagB/SusD family nutrient uptake outer membrane protein n=1 Tax=Rapidithrix thailandica TaxID=413964 RepID=A0AAW9S9C2_9BACT